MMQETELEEAGGNPVVEAVRRTRRHFEAAGDIAAFYAFEALCFEGGEAPTPTELARLLGTSESAVRLGVQRVREHLREEMARLLKGRAAGKGSDDDAGAIVR